MLRFKNYLSEEVLPTAGVKNGVIDIENTAVRGQINATLANVTAQPAVTPYIVLHRISKALSYFHIIMPKRAYLEGDKGIEVVEVKQFGHRMGMTNDGQFIHDVPSKYFLFISYRLASSMGADYAAVGNALSSVGGMFKVTAKLVDEAELQSLLSMAEISLAEDCDAEKQQLKAKAMAPKEGMHTALGDCDCSQGDSPSTKSAVDTSMRRKDKKLSAAELDEELSPGARELTLHADNDQHLHRSSHQPIIKNLQRKHDKNAYDHVKATKLWKYHADRAAKSYEKQHGGKFSVADRKAAAAHFADSARDDHGFGSVKKESIDEAMTRKQKVRRFMSHDPDAGERILAMGKKEREEKKSFASAKKEIKRLKEEEQIDEASYEKLDKYVRNAHVSGTGAAARGEIAMHRGQKTRLHRANKTGEKREQGINLALDKMAGRALVPAKRKEKMEEEKKLYKVGATKKDKSGRTVERRDYSTHSSIVATHDKEGKSLQNKWGGYNPDRTGTPKYIEGHFKNLEEETLDEKLTKSMSAGEVISDFIHSKDPKFKGKSKKMRQKMALGAYYGMHPEKSKLDEMMSRIKKTTAHRKMATSVDTQTRHALGAKKEDTKTILVTKKGDPRAAAGGGVRRIPKDKFDPSIYNRASE